MRQYRPETYTVDLEQTIKIETNNILIELIPNIQIIEYKPIPQWSNAEVQLRAENLNLSLRRIA